MLFEALTAEPTLTGLFGNLVLQLIVWSAFFHFGTPFVNNIVKDEKWLDGFARREQKTMKALLGMELDLDEAKKTWSLWITAGIQHMVSGFFGVWLYLQDSEVIDDSVLSKHLAMQLFRYAVLSEVAFDLYDLCTKTYQHFFTETGIVGGKITLMLVSLHHPASVCLAIPCLLVTPEHPSFHAIVVALVAAGGITILASFGCQMLDITKQSNIWVMRSVSFCSLVVMAWARVFVFLPSTYRLLMHIYTISGTIFWLGCVLAINMFLFNVFFVADSATKFVKALKLKSTTSQVHALHHAARRGSLGFRAPLHPSQKARVNWIKVRAAKNLGVFHNNKNSNPKKQD